MKRRKKVNKINNLPLRDFTYKKTGPPPVALVVV